MSPPTLPDAPDPAAEAMRLETLQRHGILDTAPEPAFDRITRLVRAIFDVSMSTITLIDGHRQWFKARQGMTDSETARGPALCNVAIRSAAPLIVPDTLADARFKDNPFVVGAPYIRFYAGAPLVMPNGAIVGTLCAMDGAAQRFDGRAVDILQDLAGIVVDAIARRPEDATPIASPQATYRRVLKAGRIAFNAGRSIIDCTIRGLSDDGALIDVDTTMGVPQQFKLAMLAEGASRMCRVVARRDKHLEVVFD